MVPAYWTYLQISKEELGLIYMKLFKLFHNIQLYLSLIHPSLEYASQVWDSNLSKDIDVLENIQKFALSTMSNMKIY